jgi:hypothetical protein
LRRPPVTTSSTARQYSRDRANKCPVRACYADGTSFADFSALERVVIADLIRNPGCSIGGDMDAGSSPA